MSEFIQLHWYEMLRKM